MKFNMICITSFMCVRDCAVSALLCSTFLAFFDIAWVNTMLSKNQYDHKTSANDR